MLKIISNFFKKKEPIVSEKVTREFNVDEFNEWLKTECTDYDGNKGCPGIFLRLDKLSYNLVEAYLRRINQDISFNNVNKARDEIYYNWKHLKNYM